MKSFVFNSDALQLWGCPVFKHKAWTWDFPSLLVLWIMNFVMEKKKKFTRKSLRIAIMKLKTLLSSPTIKRLCISCTICSFSKCIIFEAARYKIRISGELAFYEEALTNNDTARGMMTVFNVHICFAQVLINVSNNLTILLASKHLRL